MSSSAGPMASRMFLVALPLLVLYTTSLEAAPSKGLYVSVLQEPQVLSSVSEIERLTDFCRENGIDSIYLQVYRANKSWFPSQHADDSPYRKCQGAVGEDPLALLIRRAHARGIEVHAWMNLMSLSANADAPILRKLGLAALTRKPGQGTSLADLMVDGQYFLEPSDEGVRRELKAILRELLERYPQLDGVQFDYIRYPDLHPFYGYTEPNIRAFEAASGVSVQGEGTPGWKEWRRGQVTGLLAGMAEEARKSRPGIQVSGTGLMPYSRAYHEAFQDWRRWIKEGVVDFVTLMCYAKDEERFRYFVQDARRRLGRLGKVKLAVGAYALSADPDVFGKQWALCEDADGRGCVSLDYGSLSASPALSEALGRGGDRR